ncbi:MAG: hypothetical protein H6876_07760 [Hyphomicrobiaceae bacterium]|nr:hypothetical protein [Hyphomicrobiaceae bacterium]
MSSKYSLDAAATGFAGVGQLREVEFLVSDVQPDRCSHECERHFIGSGLVRSITFVVVCRPVQRKRRRQPARRKCDRQCSLR